MKNQHPLLIAIFFMMCQFMAPLYYSLFTGYTIQGDSAFMWCGISSGIMACILLPVYAKREKKLALIEAAKSDARFAKSMKDLDIRNVK